MGRYEIRVTLIYVALASLWVLGSDALVRMVFPAHAHILQSWKGEAFVVATGALLFLVLRALRRSQERIEEELRGTISRLEKYRWDYESLVDSLPEIFLRTTADGRILVVSQSGVHQLGYTRRELASRNMSELVCRPEDWKRMRDAILASHRDRATLRLQLRRKDGTCVWKAVTLLPRWSGGKSTYIDAIAWDAPNPVEETEE